MGGVRMERGKRLDLETDVRTGVQKKPARIIRRNGKLRLSSRLTVEPALTQPPAI